MSDFWSLEPEVAGELGDRSVLDTSVHPPRVSKLEYRFTGWLGDDLLETFPCYIVTEPLGAAVVGARLSGFSLDDVEVAISEDFAETYPGRTLPAFRWLRVTGQAGVDDFGISDDHTLVVSDAALGMLRRYNLSQCAIEEYEG